MSQHAVTRTVCISNPQGLHARPAELFAKLALGFESDIEVIKDDRRVDAKSILHILTLGAEHGTELIVEARGVDAEAAVEALVELVNSNFAGYENSQT
jgi:phosphotransferase system HPr (HPr) family protein